MSVSLNKWSLTAGIEFLAGQSVAVTDKLSGAVFALLDGAVKSRFRPSSLGEVVLQIKKSASASLATPEGNYLIEIVSDVEGRLIFSAVGESLEPVIIREGKKNYSGALWEVKVSEYLQKIVKNCSSIEYGVVAARWKEERFKELKEKFSAEGFLRNIGQKVMLKLPDEQPMIFSAPQAEWKAEMVLKHFFQERKTPIEELKSQPWDLLNRLFVGYLYLSGFILSPWVHDHVRLSRPFEDSKVIKDGYLSSDELKEMALNPALHRQMMDLATSEEALQWQLESVAFQFNGYTQTYEYGGTRYQEEHVFSSDKEIHSRTVCPLDGFSEEYFTEVSEKTFCFTQKKLGKGKTQVQKATFAREDETWRLVNEENYAETPLLTLSQSRFASQLVAHTATVYMAALITRQNPQIALISTLFQMLLGSELAAAKAIGARRSAPITIVTPLPNLALETGATLNYGINLQTGFQVSNPNQNLELSILLANGQPAPAWLSMGIGPLSLIKTFVLGGNSYNVYVTGNYAYVGTVTSNTNVFYFVNIANPASPLVVGSWSSSSSYFLPPLGLYVSGNYMYTALSSGSGTGVLQVVNVANPAAPTLAATFPISTYLYGMYASGNYVYLLTKSSLSIVSIANPTSPAQVGSIAMSTNGNGPVYVKGNYAFVATRGSTGLVYNVNIVNIAVPSNPVLVTTISGFFYGMAVKGHYLFGCSAGSLSTYDISTISSPVLVSTIFFSGLSNSVSLTLEGNYIYISLQGTTGTIAVIDISDILNPQFVAFYPTNGSPENIFLSGNNVFIADDTAGLVMFNAASRVLSGTPSPAERGLLLLNVTAQDDLGNSLVDEIAVHVGDMGVQPIPNQQVYVGNATLFTLNSQTFQYPNATFSYSAQLVGGLPLPSFMNFDPETLTFLFSPQSGDQNTYRILVSGDDGYGGEVSTTFDLSVRDRIPVEAKPLANQTAYTGQFFDYVVATNSFTDGDGDPLTYTAALVGGAPLPAWLFFDPALCRFFGTPFGRNTYRVQLNANDGFGGVVSGIFTITVPNSAPILLNPISTQLAGSGTPFSFTFNSNTFYDVDGDTLSYSTGPLPTFLSFNNATRTFTGTPQLQDVGSYSISVVAKDPLGAAGSTSFSLTVLSSTNDLPPVLVRSIPDVTVTSGIPFNQPFNNGTFQDPQHQTLTYTATLEGGAPLPAGVYFDASGFSLYGVIEIPQTMRITIKAADRYGAYAIDTFTLTVINGASYPPVVLNPLPDEAATVGDDFHMVIPQNTFGVVNGAPLNITVIQSGGLPLPDWLKWNPETLSFSGKPGPFDTNTYSPQEHIIDVWATDNVGSVKTSFRLTVQGQSFWATFITYGFSVTAGALTALGIWEKRALIWNFFNKKKYQTAEKTAIVGEPFSHQITLDRSKVKEVKAYRSDKALPQKRLLPDGLGYEEDALEGTPTGEDSGRFTVRVIDRKGYIHEEFELIIKNEGEDDPEKEIGSLEAAREYYGKVKKRLPKEFPLKNLK